MNFRMIIKNLGIVMIVEAACMLPSLFVSLIYGQEDYKAFIMSIVITLVIGFALYRIRIKNPNIYARDGFAIVALGWIVVSLFGALPAFISGSIPSYIDSVFETVSGFTTTGASILREVESLPRGILFWRSFTHWLGGMGVLVFMLAILPAAGANTLHIMKAESPGPNPGKLVPKIGQTAKILYLMYCALTLVEIVLLLIAGMPLFDTLIHSFGTAGTGGFSNMNASVGAYNNVWIEIIISVFMLLFGINFTLYYQGIKGGIKSIFKEEEFRFYMWTVIAAIVLITWNTFGNVFNSVWESLRHASFQVSTIITTTGYATADFNLWPAFSKSILVVLMFIGASAGSTGGGIKCIRFVLLFKTIKREIMKIIHPRSVYTVRMGGRIVEDDTLTGVMTFFFTYIAITTGGVLLISIDGKDLVSTFTSVVATISNIGPGLEIVGPMGNYADFSPLSKGVFSIIMLFGRLEIFPMMILFTKTFWKRVNI